MTQATIHCPAGVVRAVVACTAAERRRGLSRSPGLLFGTGMLLAFEYPGFHVITMRGVKFPLDVVWIDPFRLASFPLDVVWPGTRCFRIGEKPGRNEGGTVLYVAHKALPGEARVVADEWCDRTAFIPATYVLEVGAGAAKELGLRPGCHVELFYD